MSYGLATGGIPKSARLGLGAPAPDALRLAQRPARVARLLRPSCGQRGDAIARSGIEASRVAHLAVVDRVLDVAGGGDGHAHAGIAHAPVQQRLGPRPDAVVGQEAQLARGRRRPREGALLERTYEDDAEAATPGERQQLGFDLALARVVRNLDRLDASRLDDRRHPSEVRRAPVRDPDRADLALRLELLEVRQVGLPRLEVVDLVEVDHAAVPLKRAADLLAGLARGAGPDLGRDDHAAPPRAERPGQDVL